LDDLLICGLNSGFGSNFMKENSGKISDLFSDAGGRLINSGVSAKIQKRSFAV